MEFDWYQALTNMKLSPGGFFWNAPSTMITGAFGTREEKLKEVSTWLPFTIKKQGEPIPFRQAMIYATEDWKKNPKYKDYLESRVFFNTNIPMPSLGDLGKYALLGIIGIAGIYLLGKFIGGKK